MSGDVASDLTRRCEATPRRASAIESEPAPMLLVLLAEFTLLSWYGPTFCAGRGLVLDWRFPFRSNENMPSEWTVLARRRRAMSFEWAALALLRASPSESDSGTVSRVGCNSFL